MLLTYRAHSTTHNITVPQNTKKEQQRNHRQKAQIGERKNNIPCALTTAHNRATANKTKVNLIFLYTTALMIHKVTPECCMSKGTKEKGSGAKKKDGVTQKKQKLKPKGIPYQ